MRNEGKMVLGDGRRQGWGRGRGMSDVVKQWEEKWVEVRARRLRGSKQGAGDMVSEGG